MIVRVSHNMGWGELYGSVVCVRCVFGCAGCFDWCGGTARWWLGNAFLRVVVCIVLLRPCNSLFLCERLIFLFLLFSHFLCWVS